MRIKVPQDIVLYTVEGPLLEFRKMAHPHVNKIGRKSGGFRYLRKISYQNYEFIATLEKITIICHFV